MSGFDFDGLRDPLPPEPGSRERAAVDAHARQLHAHARRNRFLAGATSLVAVVAVVFGVIAVRHDNGPAITVVGGSSTTTTHPRAGTTVAPTRVTQTTTGNDVIPPTIPPTTTTAPVAPASPAVSASFVSASHGWVLEQSGEVLTTTNGGASWQQVGNDGKPSEEGRIRFIGASDGFAYPGPDSNAGPLLITHDAGATWMSLSTPFSDIYDLEISGGNVYVVALKSGQPFDFQIWSSPVTHFLWKLDPLTLQVGAGPIPIEQLVLAGGQGWILNEDRTVISGARLQPNGHWASWRPPCLDFGGTAEITASSSSDLVAVCSTGPATPPSDAMTTQIAFSHDGGSTFQTRTVPDAKFGSNVVLSPSPDTAVIATGGDLQRTTDGGATWHVVAQLGDTGGGPDYGFTTPTQGFIILANGKMLMTYDAGATWKPVTLP